MRERERGMKEFLPWHDVFLFLSTICNGNAAKVSRLIYELVGCI